MKRRFVLAMVLASCGSAPPEGPLVGVVSRLTFTPAHNETYSTTCSGIDGKQVACTGNRLVPDRWEVAVATEGDEVVVVRVDPLTFDACRLGSQYEQGRCLG